MRAPHLLPVTAVTALALALALTACTSEDPVDEVPPATDDASVTSDDGLEGGPGSNGWLCQYVSPSATDAAGSRSVTSTRGAGSSVLSGPVLSRGCRSR